MRLLETTCAISFLCLCLSWRAAQQPLPPPQPKPVPPLSPTKSPNPVLDAMQGAWRLTKLESLTINKEGLTEVGYLLVAGDYFSFELHMGWTLPNGATANRTYQSGTHRFEVDDNYKMSTSSLIGSTSDQKGMVLFEQPGHRREYTVDCTGDTLTLKRDDSMTFTFERLEDKRPKRDFYGRPIKPNEKKPEEKKKPEEPPGDGTPPKKD